MDMKLSLEGKEGHTLGMYGNRLLTIFSSTGEMGEDM
jgi:hypothetical protein